MSDIRHRLKMMRIASVTEGDNQNLRDAIQEIDRLRLIQLATDLMLLIRPDGNESDEIVAAKVRMYGAGRPDLVDPDPEPNKAYQKAIAKYRRMYHRNETAPANVVVSHVLMKAEEVRKNG